ncbi:transcriptional regulator [Ligilactobacillus equi DSM 15833 = JCM 10991]|uniref:Transcriptional regulator n=2 Tax=Ligilactobacillus equi TaxID=137357 RepID=A0A0R1TFM4_9LACO|nr:LysR family transcriptional regulator [Ligilactobacillus equi]KRL80097.1 transcriptional regulator [Ligilactobacillus equi DSM 15833 = JCM 10991]
MRSFEADQNFIKILEAVVRFGSVSKAAEYLFISQPSLSKKIKQQEDSLGVTLIDRRHHPIRLTEAGEFYLSNLKRLTTQYAAVYRDLQRMSSSNHGQLSIGVTQSLGQKILPLLLPQYHNVYEDVKLTIYEDTSENHENRLIRENLDLYVGILPIYQPDIHYETLATEPACLVIPYRHPKFVAGQAMKKIKTIGQIEPFLREFPYISAKENVGFQRQVTTTLAGQGIIPDNILQSNSLPTIAKLVERGLGASIMPQSVLNLIDTEAVNIYQLPADKLSYTLVVAYKDTVDLTSQMKAFIRLAKGIGPALLK